MKSLRAFMPRKSLENPNLVGITKVGQTRLDNTLFVYAVMEQIEQSLSDVLLIQALSPEEGRQVAEAMVGALTAIHQQGMSHGHVEAASILATGETVKLRSDCLQMSPQQPGPRCCRHWRNALPCLHPAKGALRNRRAD